MITIRIKDAQNLPIFNNHLRKTIVSCFSKSSYRYFYGSFKNNKKTRNPEWNIELNIDLFRLIDLNFSLYGYRYSKDNFFFGNVNIDFIQFLTKPPGNQILASPGTEYKQVFPIDSCNSPNAFLTLSFSYSSVVNRPIQFNPSSYLNTTIHIWTSYSPLLGNESNPVEIELLQAFYFQNPKSANEYGIYYNLTKEISWQSVGKSTQERYFLGDTGLSQVHSISVSKLSGKYTFFILNVLNYTGKVTLNFLSEKRGKTFVFDNIQYMKPKRKHPKIGILNSIEINVQNNRKYLVPFYLYYKVNSAQSYSYEFNQLNSQSMVILDKSSIPNYNNLNYSDQISSEISFNSQIIECLNSIPRVQNVHFLRTNLLPINKPISLTKTLHDYQLQPNFELRIYVSGSRIMSTQNGTFHDYWNQGFIVYDKKTGKKSSNLVDFLKNFQIDEHSSHSSNSFLPFDFKCNFIQNLNLNQIETDKILVYFIYSNSPLGASYPPGFFLISHFSNNNETLFFYNPIITDVMKAHYVVCFRIEFIENDWKIIPMKRFFKDQKQMNFAVESMRNNNWIYPNDSNNQLNQSIRNNIPETSENQYLINSRNDSLNI